MTPEPLAQIQNTITEMFLVMPSSTFVQLVPLRNMALAFTEMFLIKPSIKIAQKTAETRNSFN